MGLLMMLSGRQFDPLNLKVDDIQPEDIAQGLATSYRFNGQTAWPYSVAEHSVYTARVVKMHLRHYLSEKEVMEGPGRPILRQALLHDAPEYILPDMSYPIKIQPSFDFYREMEDNIWRVVAERFAVPVEIYPLIKEIDKRIASNEKLILQGDAMPPHWVDYMRKHPPLPKHQDVIDRYPVAPRQARRRFLDFYELVREG